MTTANSKSNRFALTYLVAFAASAITGTAFAVPPTVATSDGVPSIQVRYADLNLATDTGTNALYHRIAAAARLVCPQADIRDLPAMAASKRCQAEAVAQAVRDVNSPQLAMVLATHTNRG
jgi:UrcA family protein